MSVPEVIFVREREAAADANAAKKPKTTPKPKAASKPKANAVKDQPHVVIEGAAQRPVRAEHQEVVRETRDSWYVTGQGAC